MQSGNETEYELHLLVDSVHIQSYKWSMSLLGLTLGAMPYEFLGLSFYPTEIGTILVQPYAAY
jgi:hypothetical protein